MRRTTTTTVYNKQAAAPGGGACIQKQAEFLPSSLLSLSIPLQKGILISSRSLQRTLLDISD